MAKHLIRQSAKGLQIRRINIVPRILGEAKNEERPRPVPEQDNAAKPAGLALPRPRRPLLDHAPPQISIHQAAFRSRNGVT